LNIFKALLLLFFKLCGRFLNLFPGLNNMALFRMGLTDAETKGEAAIEYGMGQIKAPTRIQTVLCKIFIKKRR
jgi:hypothetical protein